MIAIKRVYDAPQEADGTRVLIDRVWPRGVTKEAAQIEDWIKEIAPSAELRRWFDHDSAKWPQFQQRYWRELDRRPDLIRRLRELSASRRLTLVYAAQDRDHNNAVALKAYLEGSQSALKSS